MRTWRRASIATRCGSCGTVVPVGQPLLILTLGHAVKFRCGKCEEAPADLPENPAPRDTPDTPDTPDTSRRAPMQPLRGLALDWQKRAAGEREPGSDDI